MKAFEDYEELANKFLKLAREKKTLLVAARKCYIIATENAITI